MTFLNLKCWDYTLFISVSPATSRGFSPHNRQLNNAVNEDSKTWVRARRWKSGDVLWNLQWPCFPGEHMWPPACSKGQTLIISWTHSTLRSDLQLLPSRARVYCPSLWIHAGFWPVLPTRTWKRNGVPVLPGFHLLFQNPPCQQENNPGLAKDETRGQPPRRHVHDSRCMRKPSRDQNNWAGRLRPNCQLTES